MPEKSVPSRRIIELDLLRGFFIIVIILDHLQFWPSPWQFMTGEGRLWASAAEGFFIISGLLIGYLRAYKGKHTPLKSISKKLLERAGLLWLWCIIITLIAVGLSIVLPGNNSLLPKLPEASVLGSPLLFLWNVITMNYASDWIYFLRLYAIMLAVTPVFLWLIRKKHALTALALSLGTYLISLAFGISEAALQWQVLFFGAAFIGWKLEDILSWFRARPRLRFATLLSLIVFTLGTMALSYFMVHGWSYVESSSAAISLDAYVSIRSHVDPVFSNNPLVPARIALSFIWFFGLLSLFHLLRAPMKKYLGWLLMTFGEASLTAYCLQAILLVFITKFVQLNGDFYVNGLVGLAVVLLVWGFMKIPFVRKVLPQ
jgi:hypothetical protein